MKSGGMRPKFARRSPGMVNVPSGMGKLVDAGGLRKAAGNVRPPMKFAAGGVAKERKGQLSVGKPKRGGGA